MVILKKPVRLIVATIIGLVSSVALAGNPMMDTVAHVKAKATQEVTIEEQEVESAADVETQASESQKKRIEEAVEHHLGDSHDFVFFTDEAEKTYYGFSLPVILFDNGLKIFSSSELHHGESVAKVEGNYYKLVHGKIYKTDTAGTINLDEHHHPTNEMPLDFSITKNVLALLIVSVMLLIMFTGLARSYKRGPIPTGFGRVLEPLVIYIRDEIAIPNIGEKKYRKFMGYLLTVFFLIWLLNLLGMTPIGINVTGNITVTCCLAIFTYLITQFKGNKDYWKHIFWMPGVPMPMKIILAPIEVLGTLTKPFALMIRLFANITAGHVVAMSLIAMIFVTKNLARDLPISIGLTLFTSLIEVLVAFLQAFIFTMLSSLFIGMAVEEHHHDEHH